MSEFDPAELARLAEAARMAEPRDTTVKWRFEVYYAEHCDSIVAALQPRTVTTVDELNALPARALIRGSDYFRVWEKLAQNWIPMGGKLRADDRPSLPATVLWLPEDGA